jgi:hypothetical protein
VEYSAAAAAALLHCKLFSSPHKGARKPVRAHSQTLRRSPHPKPEACIASSC